MVPDRCGMLSSRDVQALLPTSITKSKGIKSKIISMRHVLMVSVMHKHSGSVLYYRYSLKVLWYM